MKTFTRLKFIYIALLFLLAHCLSHEQARGESVIQIINDSLPSIVRVKAENAQVGKGKNAAFRDEKGRIFIMKTLQGAQYRRFGAGVIINPQGLIVTNAHTVRDAGRVIVTFNSGKETTATVAWLAPQDDTAFIQPDNPEENTAPLPFADSDSVKLGSVIYTVGSSEVLNGTLTGGKVTGIGKSVRRRQTNQDFADLIQTSFNVYPGDSGGPILDKEGKFLGIIVAAETAKNHTSFAVPSGKIKKHYREYLQSNNKK